MIMRVLADDSSCLRIVRFRKLAMLASRMWAGSDMGWASS